MAAAGMCSTIVIVVPAQIRATAAASVLLARLDNLTPDLRLVVRGPAPSGLAADDISAALGLPLFGELRTESVVATALDRGELFLRNRSSLAGVARRLVGQVTTS
jgi:hypothetical protein